MSVGRLLPWEDRPLNPSTMEDVKQAEWEEVPLSDRVAHKTKPDALIVPVRKQPDGGTFVPLMARASTAAKFQWDHATRHVDQDRDSYADLIATWDMEERLVTVNADKAEASREIMIATMVLSPSFAVPGMRYAGITVEFQEYELDNDFSVSFGPGIEIDNLVLDRENSRALVHISVSEDAEQGLREITIHNNAENIIIKDAFTVYAGVMQNLKDLLNRPPDRRVLNFMFIRLGPRTVDQDDRVKRILEATDRSSARTAWREWTAADASISSIPTRIESRDIAVLVAAAVQFEDRNSSAVNFPEPKPSLVPISMWRGLVDFLWRLESAWDLERSIVPLASVAEENSYGLLQFHDLRASEEVFAGASGYSVPIYSPGIIPDWKDKIVDIGSIEDMAGFVESLHAKDWRADPYKSLVNGIRSLQALYGQLILGTDGRRRYDPKDSFRVELGSGRAHSKGSQRDCFEFFAVVHQLPANAFGDKRSGGSIEGAIVRSPTPDEWLADSLHMLADGVKRAEQAQAFYKKGGGYK